MGRKRADSTGSTEPDRERTGAAGRPGVGRRPGVREVLLAGGHVTVLWALAAAQPIFDLLGRTPEFFAVRGSTPREIVGFALALTFLPPLAVVAAEAVAALLHRKLWLLLHLSVVAVLSAIVLVQVGKRLVERSGAEILVAAAVGGVVAAALYARVSAVRFAATLLLPAPLVLTGLFLFHSPVSRLVLVEEVEVRAAKVESTAPVVLIVFDELPTISLMNADGGVDASRFPNFARLADRSTWYRSATTVSPSTERAVPAILTGRYVEDGRLPILADHPHNLFTLLAGAYELRAIEVLTNLCPPRECGTRTAPSAGRATSLAQDVAAVYLQVLAPDSLSHRLPQVGDTWFGFLEPEKEERPRPAKPRQRAGNAGKSGDSQRKPAERPRNARPPLPSCGRAVCKFADLLTAGRGPALYFFHALLPHTPWLYLPSGRRYLQDVGSVPGTYGPDWGDDEWLLRQGYQRHLLQLGYADRALGVFLDRLDAAGLLDRSLVVVVADHGLGFETRQPRRLSTADNLEALAFVPLFLKLPGQRDGRIDDGFAQTVDVLPTIADAIGVELTAPVDGRSLLDPLPRDGTVRVAESDGTWETGRLSELLGRRDEALSRQVDWFPDGEGWAAVYGLGGQTGLLGADVADLAVVQGSASVELNGAVLYRAVDPRTGAVPTHVTGAIDAGRGAGTVLAVAVNGRIAAVTRSYERDGERFGAMVPEDALVRGANDLRVYAVEQNSPPRLVELQGVSLAYTLRDSGEAHSIEVEGGASIPIGESAVEGEVRGRRTHDTATLVGVAFDRRRGEAAERLIVFVGERAVFAARGGNRAGWRFLDHYGVENAGFRFELPGALLPPSGSGPPVRVFAVHEGVATELRYGSRYPWPHE